MTGSTAVRALHVNDCAFTAAHLVAEAQRRGLPWSFQPVAATGRTWSGPVARAERAALGAAWLARLAARAAANDLLHVHSGSVVRHSRLVPKRFALHLHGTDIRTLQYDPHWREVIQWGVRRAQHVFYATPDLAEHTLPLRPDATYVPVPIDVAALPPSSPSDDLPVVFVAARWEDAKGVDALLVTATATADAVRGQAQVLGLDWGPGADRARAAGIELVATRPHADYLRLVAGASVVIGQASGALGASDLEAIGIGVPVVIPAALELYREVQPPVLGDSPASAAEAAAALVSGQQSHDAAAARAWVERHHSPARGVDLVAGVYGELAANGWRAA